MGHNPISVTRQWKRGRIRRAVGPTTLVVCLFLWLFPIYWLVNTSLKLKVQVESSYPVWVPRPLTVTNFRWLIANLNYAALWRSVYVVAITVIVSVAFGSVMAYALARFENRINKHVEFWVISTRMMPPAALIIPYYILLLRSRLLNTGAGLSILYIAINLPLVTWLVLAYLRSLGTEPEEAASLEGCGAWKTFWYIVFPQIRASIGAAALLCAILTWNEFFIAFIVTSSNITFPVQVSSFLANGMDPEYGHIAAAGVLLSLPAVFLTLAFRRQLLSGLVAFAGGHF